MEGCLQEKQHASICSANFPPQGSAMASFWKIATPLITTFVAVGVLFYSIYWVRRAQRARAEGSAVLPDVESKMEQCVGVSGCAWV